MDNNDASFVGSIPELYDRGLGPMIFADFATDMARLVAARGPARVLEIAAGTGIVTRALRDALPATAELVATDLNPPMLEVARAKFGAGEAVAFRQADALALPFADRSFDAVACQFGIMFYPDKQQSHREAWRVLAPEGWYHLSVWDSHADNPFGAIAHRIVAEFFPADPPQFYRVPFSYSAIDPIKQGLLEAGFADLEVAVARIDKTVPDAELFARGMVLGNPLVDQIRARGGVEPERIVEAIAAELRKAFGDEPGVMPLQAILVSARKGAKRRA